MNTTPKAASGSLTDQEIASELAPFGVHASERQIATIRKYVALLLLWNQKLSLTAVDIPLEIVGRHFGESMFLGQIIPTLSGRLADVGTGGGFPGLPLKIAFPELELILIESNAKKSAFLRELVRELGLHNAQVFRGSYAEYSAKNGRFDYICCRALGDYRNFLDWATGVLAPEGRVAMWLGQEDSVKVGRAPGWWWDLPVRIPESQKRVISIGRLKTAPSDIPGR